MAAPVLPEIYGVEPSLYLELPAILTGALSGGGHAVRKQFDGVGVVTLAIATGLGGGVTRDLLLGHGPPVALMQGRYLEIAFLAAILAFLFSTTIARARRFLRIIDALALGFFGVAGAERALAFGLPSPGALLVGTVSAIGGSIVRDVLANEVPALLVPGELYAIPAVAGICLYLTLVRGLHSPRPIPQILAIAATATLRVVGVWRGWQGPKPPNGRLFSRGLRPSRSRPREGT